MEYPTFKLEGIVKVNKDDLEDFEGPLTLILQLLAKNKIEIQDIQISLILEQYLAYIEEMKSLDLEVASEFVAMASHLVYIKTRMLLDTKEEISELDELIASLETLKARNTYGQIKLLSDTFRDMYTKGAGFISKPQEYISSIHEYRYFHEKEDIYNALMSVLSKDDGSVTVTVPRTFSVPTREVYPVTDKSNEIISRLRHDGKLSLFTLFSECKSRTELVATFLSVLELCKSGNMRLMGEDTDDLIIELNETIGEVQ